MRIDNIIGAKSIYLECLGAPYPGAPIVRLVRDREIVQILNDLIPDQINDLYDVVKYLYFQISLNLDSARRAGGGSVSVQLKDRTRAGIKRTLGHDLTMAQAAGAPKILTADEYFGLATKQIRFLMYALREIDRASKGERDYIKLAPALRPGYDQIGLTLGTQWKNDVTTILLQRISQNSLDADGKSIRDDIQRYVLERG